MSIDYIQFRGYLQLGPTQPRRQCFDVQIITDITFEGNEEFQVYIDALLPNQQRTLRIVTSIDMANVTIIDYNGERYHLLFIDLLCLLFTAITAQQPASTSAGLTNLINTTIPDNITCRLLQLNGVECSSAGEVLALVIPPACNRSLTLLIMDTNRIGAQRNSLFFPTTTAD